MIWHVQNENLILDSTSWWKPFICFSSMEVWFSQNVSFWPQSSSDDRFNLWSEIPWLYFISSTSLVMSITITALFFGEKNLWLAFQEISICSTLCIPLSVEYIECTEMARTDFLLFVLTATLGGIFLCGANDWFNNYLCSSRIFHQFMLLPIIWIYQERCTV